MFEVTPEEDYWRLRAMEAAYDVATLRTLDGIGVGAARGIQPGWRCLEVAAGAGSVALAIQARAGSVFALDQNVGHVDRFASPSFLLIPGRVEDADLPTDLDLVHVRFLLDLLTDPRRVVKRLVQALRPGGWIVAEEFDDVTMAESLGDPKVQELHDRVLRAKQSAWTDEGHENFLGRNLPDWFTELGLVNVESECSCRVRQSGTPGTTTWKMSVMALQPALEGAGLTRAEFDQYVAQLDKPGLTYMSPLVVRAWGQVPR